MNDKLSSYREAIFYRHRQRYTSEMIKLWLHQTHKLSVDTSSIDRSIHKSMKNVSSFERITPDDEYSYYRSKVAARRQKRNYKRNLAEISGTIEHHRIESNHTASQIHALLTKKGISTSLSSVYRELRLIDDKNKIPNRGQESS